jgi:hypothetical protein
LRLLFSQSIAPGSTDAKLIFGAPFFALGAVFFPRRLSSLNESPIWGVYLYPQVVGLTPSQDQLPRFAFSDIVISNDLGARLRCLEE